MICERTIRTSIRTRGLGVHSGKPVDMTFHPAAEGTGIIFRRVDFSPAVEIPARLEYVGDTTLSTSLHTQGIVVSTVEHLLSAISALGLDNLYIDLNAGEVPIMDGSAAPFVFILRSAGVVAQKAKKRFIRVLKPVEVRGQDGKYCRLEPFDGFKISFGIHFDHPEFDERNQSATFDISSTSFITQLARARTFGFVSDMKMLQSKNLALGASLDNAIGLDETKILNKNGLRYVDEFVRHKILDAVGDLFLLGHAIVGQFTAFKSGHELNNRLLNALHAQSDTWEVVHYDAESLPIHYAWGNDMTSDKTA